MQIANYIHTHMHCNLTSVPYFSFCFYRRRGCRLPAIHFDSNRFSNKLWQKCSIQFTCDRMCCYQRAPSPHLHHNIVRWFVNVSESNEREKWNQRKVQLAEGWVASLGERKRKKFVFSWSWIRTVVCARRGEMISRCKFTTWTVNSFILSVWRHSDDPNTRAYT